MNKVIISFVIFAGLLSGCKDNIPQHNNTEHGHFHNDENHTEKLEPITYTLTLII